MRHGIRIDLFAHLVAACAALLPVLASAQAPGVTPDSILIGQSAPLSGSNKELGEDIRNGALAYFSEVNRAGGVDGRMIKLITLDDGNDVKRAGQNTQKLIVDDHVFALFGYASATLSRLALPLVEQYKVPFLAPFTGADPMREFRKYVYNMRASYANELEKIVDYYTLFGIKRFAIVYYDDVIGKRNLTAVEAALRVRSLSAVSVAAFKTRKNPDIAQGVAAVMKGKPDVVILTTLYKTTSDFVKTALRDGSTAQMVSNSFPGASPLAHELGADGVGVVISQVVPPPSKASVAVVAEYRAAIEKQLGRKAYSFTSLESFIAAKVAVEALRRSGKRLTRDAFLHALDSMSNYDAGGYLISFSPTNHNGSSFVELTMINKKGGFAY